MQKVWLDIAGWSPHPPLPLDPCRKSFYVECGWPCRHLSPVSFEPGFGGEVVRMLFFQETIAPHSPWGVIVSLHSRMNHRQFFFLRVALLFPPKCSGAQLCACQDPPAWGFGSAVCNSAKLVKTHGKNSCILLHAHFIRWPGIKTVPLSL